jgi:hypothetical protein
VTRQCSGGCGGAWHSYNVLWFANSSTTQVLQDKFASLRWRCSNQFKFMHCNIKSTLQFSIVHIQWYLQTWLNQNLKFFINNSWWGFNFQLFWISINVEHVRCMAMEVQLHDTKWVVHVQRFQLLHLRLNNTTLDLG